MLKTHKIGLFFFIGFLSCRATGFEISDIPVQDIKGERVYLDEFENYPATVITFLSPECPVSENYTQTINEISTAYRDIRFINIFPGKYYSIDKINGFINDYHLGQINFLDADLFLSIYLKATVTPETFVLGRDGKIKYSGAIDNWAVDLGSKRQVITEFYLKDALEAVINEMPVAKNKTKAVGCFIEKQ
ncbi:MAG: hypothetical protein ACHQFW_09230 [Chitinophagales bacterium]